MHIIRLGVICAALALAPLAHGHAAELGDPAAPLAISEWVKGGPVDMKDGKGKSIYVVEFWATWCPPCRDSIPHLTELQEKFKDENIVIIGVTREEPETVRPFVEEMGEKMDYVVAIDRDDKTSTGYMDAYGQNGIPTAFIVDKEGRVAWVGHPMGGLDEVLKQIAEGNYDIQAAKKALEAERNLNRYFELLASADSKEEARKLGESVVQDGAGDAQLLNGMAWTILTDEDIPYRDLELAKLAAEAAYKVSKGNDPDILDTYARAFFETGDVAKAIEYQEKAIELCDDERLRGYLARTLDQYKGKQE